MENGSLITALTVLLATSIGIASYAFYHSRLLRARVTRLEHMFSMVMRGVEESRLVEKKKVTKDRKRYIVFKVISQSPLSFNDVEKALKNQMIRLYGEYGLSESRLYLAIYIASTGYGVLRVSHRWKTRTIILLSTLRQVNNNPALFIPVRTTGSIRRAREIIRTGHKNMGH